MIEKNAKQLFSMSKKEEKTRKSLITPYGRSCTQVSILILQFPKK